MAKNKTRKLKRYKRKNISQLIKIIACQNKKQDKFLQRIEDLEEYLSFIEEVYVDDDGDVLISGAVFEADDAFEQILQDQLNETQNDKLEEVKKDKKKKKAAALGGPGSQIGFAPPPVGRLSNNTRILALYCAALDLLTCLQSSCQ